jgi:hypothetical protein
VQDLKPCWLSLWGLALDEVLLFELEPEPGSAIRPCVVYIPGDWHGELRQYASRSEFMKALRGRLREIRYQTFFSRFVGQRNRAAYLGKVQKLFNTRHLTHGGGAQPFDIAIVRLDLEARPIAGNFYRQCYNRHLARIQDDARVLAVPTAEVDYRVRMEHLQHWLSIGMNVLNVAALFVPVLGALMLPVAGAQLLGDFFHGVEAWENDEVGQALDYLMGVVQNLLLLSALGALHGGPPTLAGARFAGSLEPVILPNGQVRLWRPGLELHPGNVELPPTLRANAAGQYQIAGKTYVSIDGALYETTYDPRVQQWRVRHPVDTQAYQPLLAHNGMGAWHYVGETPLQWPVVRQLQRLGPGFDDLAPDTLLALWQASGVSEARLSRVYASRLPTPAILLDVIELYRPGRQLVPSSVNSGFASRLQRDFPGLTMAGVNELIDFSRSVDRLRMLQSERIPLRLAEAAREYLQQSRLSQALLGFYFEELANTDTLTLALGQLERLGGRPQDWPVDLAGGGGMRAQGPFARLFEAMTDSQRTLLRLEPQEDAASLRLLLASKLVAQRSEAAKMLGLRPLRPRLQTLRRLSGGRVGYPMGGVVGRFLPDTDARLQALFPGLSTDQLRQFKAVLQMARVPLEVEVTRLEVQFRTLKSDLAAWASLDGAHSVQRRLLADQLIDCWQRNATPGARAYAYEGYRLSLSELDIGELPTLGEGFEHVTELAIHDVQLGEGSEAFLRSFTGARALVVSQAGLTAIPEALRAMPQLREVLLRDNHIELTTSALANLRGLRYLQVLDLSGNGMTITLDALDRLSLLSQLRSLNLAGNESLFPVGAFERIAALTGLKKLYLSGNWITLQPADVQALAGMTELEILSMNDNPLDLAPDVSRMHRLAQLNLENTGLTAWPAGLSQLENLQAVNLSFNRLQTVPLDLLRMWHIDLDGNPLTVEALQHFADQGGNYRAGRVESIRSESELSGDISQWLPGSTPEQRERWAQMQLDEGAQPFFRVLQRLTDTAEHTPDSAASRQQVWQLLDAAADSGQLRERLYALARGEETCADRAALVFSQLEVERRVFELSLETLPKPEQQQQMAELARHLFRLDEVDKAARRAMIQWRSEAPEVDIDDIEVLLAFRIGLAEELELPDQPADALFLDLADQVTPGLLQVTATAVRAAENSSALLEWAVNQAFWTEFLKSGYGDDFVASAQPWHLGLEYLDACVETSNPLPAKLSPQVLSALSEALDVPLSRLYADGQMQRVVIDDQLYLTANNALTRSQQQSERELIERLTRQALNTGKDPA